MIIQKDIDGRKTTVTFERHEMILALLFSDNSLSVEEAKECVDEILKEDR